MTDNWSEDACEPECISQLQASPRPDDGKLPSRRDVISFSAVWEVAKRILTDGWSLGEEYVRAKVAQESNLAARTAAEAAEIAAREDHHAAESDVVRQKAVAKFVQNLDAIGELPEGQQILAYAKLIEANPDTLKQLEVIEAHFQRLKFVYGFRAGVQESAPVRAESIAASQFDARPDV